MGSGCCSDKGDPAKQPAAPDVQASSGCCSSSAPKHEPPKPASCAGDGCCDSDAEAEADSCCGDKGCGDTKADDNSCCGDNGCSDAEKAKAKDDCCSGGDCHDAEPAPKSHVHCEDEAHCDDRDNACNDEACCDVDSSCDNTLACCDSNDERCDEKCIIAVAALECEKACEDHGSVMTATASHEHDHAHDDNGQHPDSACNTHLARAFDQYSAYLESARCICRSILDRGWTKTCCDTKAEQTKVKPCGTSSAYASGRKNSTTHHHHQIKRRGKKQPVPTKTDGCGEKDDDCCTGNDIEHAEHAPSRSYKGLKDIGDVEKAEGLEHLALSVEGMTCSGCGNKMERTLKGLPGVSSVRVNFVMGNAECSYDASVTSVDDIIRSSEKATGFKCTSLVSDAQVLDIIASGGIAKALLDLDIPGVTQTAIINKKTVRVSYDPTIVGSRTLLGKLEQVSGGLAPPRDDPSISSGRKRLYDQLIKTLVSMAFTIPVLVIAWGPHLVNKKTGAIVSLALATIVQFIAVPDFYYPAISALVHSGSVEMDMLVVISITAAYFYSVIAFGFQMAGHPLEVEAFFETSTLLITLVLLGRLVAAFARVRAVAAVSLRSLQATTAVIIENGAEKEVDARLLQYGDVFKVGPHSVVPTDGVVMNGSSEVDESMLTGESVPVFKKEGSAMIAGTVNGSGTLTARLTRLPGKNTVTDIAQLVEEAANSKPKLQDVADRVASWFVPIVTTVAIIIVIVWLAVGFKVRNYGTGKAISNAITYAVATLAVSCPCALGLAVPMVLVVAGGIAARNGVIIKSGESTESARKVTDVVFDKTGTITEGDLDVMEEEYLVDRAEAIAITKALVAGNKHPVSLAVAKFVESLPSAAAPVSNVHVIPGAGVEAELQSSKLRAGHPKWTGTVSDPSVSRMQGQGMTLLVITRDGAPIAIYGLRTRLRSEASKIVDQLKRRNIQVHMVSGDLREAVEAVAQNVGIPNVAAQCTPAEKKDYVAGLMAEGKKVMFVGDGTNDAVAVTQADVGVQIADVMSASDVTRGAADVVLLNGLEGIPFMLEISRVSFRIMAFNFAWSGVYNVLAILFASGALVKVRIPPAFAGLGEIVSVLPVVFAASTMLLTKIKPEA